jgi:endonuclease/exonuclease/phosphatase family metal-dependent hydrolase
MLRLATFLLTLAFAIDLHAASTTQPSPATRPHDPCYLRVMTFNLRFGNPVGAHNWLERRPVTAALLKDANPDVFGTQEGLIQQLKDMQHDLGDDYTWVGVARNDGKEVGEHAAVFYRKSRLELLEEHDFWLSDTPEKVGSKSWGNNIVRITTWVRFKDRKTNKEFYFWNTHFDHQSEPSRQKSAVLMVDRINALKTDLPVIVTGDFNCGPKSVAHKTFTEAGFSDTWDTAHENRGPKIATFHGYGDVKPNGPRIDWILTRGPIEADSIAIDTFEQNGKRASDHFPVYCDLHFVSPK